MKCPYCHYTDSRVIDSRATDEGQAVRRRRACPACDARFTTYERIETIPLYVIKRDGTREPFDRDKILRGMITACQKRPVPLARLEETAHRMESTLRNRLESEVSTEAIGQMVVDELRAIDPVAYIRFASVYWRFDIQRFQEELQLLLQDETNNHDEPPAN